MINNSKAPSRFGFFKSDKRIPEKHRDLSKAIKAYPELDFEISDKELNREHAPLLELAGDIRAIAPYEYQMESFSHIYLPQKNALVNIGACAFFGCANLEDFVIPDEVCFIGDGAFAYCSTLPHIELPMSLTEVAPFLFCGCKKLDMLTLHKGVKRIHATALIGCSALSIILFYGTEEEWGAIEWVGGKDIIKNISVVFADDDEALRPTELSQAISRMLAVSEEILRENESDTLPAANPRLHSLYDKYNEASETVARLLKEESGE